MPKIAAKPSFSSAVREDPVEFARTFLINRDGTPFEPHPAQAEMLRGLDTDAVACCGRQFGKSMGFGAYGCWFATTQADRQLFVIAPSVDQSRIIFNEIAYQFSHTPLAALVNGKIKEYPFPHIRLINGSEIHGRGANNPQFIRGKPIHKALLDEAAFFKNGVIKNVIEPMFTVTGKYPHCGMAMISTPFGQGDFYEYAMAAKAGKHGRYFHYTSYDNPHADRARLDRIKEENGEDSLLWLTEYMAEFVDDDLAVFPSKLIKSALERYDSLYEDRFPLAPQEGHRYTQGVDLANVRDYFVSTIFDVSDLSLVPLVHMDRMQKKGYGHYKEVVRRNWRTYGHPKTLIDATSLGESVVEDLSDVRAEGWKFSPQSKYEVVQELSRMFAEHRIALPNVREIIDELRYFQYSFTPSKTLKMEAARGHDDIVMSLALNAHLALMPLRIGFFQGVTFERPTSRAPKPDFSKGYKDPFADLFKEV